MLSALRPHAAAAVRLAPPVVRHVAPVATRSLATLGSFKVPELKNEPLLHYAPGSPERAALRNALDKLQSECPDIPCMVGGQEIRTGNQIAQVMPTNHAHPVCTFHQADVDTLFAAADAAKDAAPGWGDMPIEDRLAVFMKAADLIATKYRAELCAAVMLGTGKNVWQAEIDAAVEVIDFLRFSARYAMEIYQMQPPFNDFGVWNRLEFRPLEGFVLAISPFNFIAIGCNLNTAPAIMGNTTIWKPSSTAVLGSYVVYKVLKEAGLPDGVINFVPCSGRDMGTHIVSHPDMAGLHFTGGTSTFNNIWRDIGDSLETYKSYPRMVGETGGKNFHMVHSSADVDHVVFNTIRGAFEYQGQKCSATSRMYVPSNLWPEMKEKLVAVAATLKMGCVTEFDTFVAGVIDRASFDKLAKYIDAAHAAPECEVITGGRYDDSKGYFIEPTIIVTEDPKYDTMCEELFGPVLTIHVYDADKFGDALEMCDSTSPYALTGSIFAQDRSAIMQATDALRNAAGNFYINDKSTGSIVAQQPFGGARQSGTNDKSGSALNLLRWTSGRSIKEQFLPLGDYRYPHMSDEE